MPRLNPAGTRSGPTPRPASDPPPSEPAPSEPASSDRPGADRPSPDRPGPGRAGAGRSGAGSPVPGARTGFGVPLFAHPLVAPAEWAELARPGAPVDWAAFDVSAGPGSRSDPLYAEALGRVRENGVPLLGRLDAVYGTRPYGELVTDASRYLDWYRVDGFYLDRAPTLRAETAECRRTAATLRALLPDGGRVVLAPGAHPYPGYAEFADQLVVFAGPWTRYRWSEVPQWTAAYPPGLFAHLVHGLPATHLDAALRIARWQGAGTVYMTDRTDRDGADPWAGLAGYWSEAVRRVREEPSPSM
ncbi:Spherulation-specific family 4 [Actinacidiphila yanglinensis]|uniref:Spherulation-specific family 4 n=1 Tax=Actinacidiphila yanglinensis TaxID=310779 RepID=A0A1H5VAW1_9ACTN|nr:spherulation-specific family 4 protein [Actinacidiphila yanglinensis]SEF83921.1 Spherulation-specific family 4 [Actinacidiphila yanglinensis]